MHVIGGSDPRVERVNIHFPSMSQSKLFRDDDDDDDDNEKRMKPFVSLFVPEC